MTEYIEKWSVVNRLIDLENELQRHKPFHGFKHAMYRKICEAEIAIGKMPAADVAPVRHGRWLYHTLIDGHIHAECSECHKIRIIDNFCPNCGAKMVEFLEVDLSGSDGYEPELIADYLIDHGVTVQEWISVKDRLPEDDSDVLAYSSIGEESRIYPACYSNGVWFDCVFNAPATDTTTHWMPLPQPPKGE